MGRDRPESRVTQDTVSGLSARPMEDGGSTHAPSSRSGRGPQLHTAEYLAFPLCQDTLNKCKIF